MSDENDGLIVGEHLLKTAYVLIVDDEPFIRGVIRDSLKKSGIRSIVEAADTTAARDAIAKFGPNALVLDINMPGETGLQFLRAIRMGETEAPRGLPVVILTSLNSDDVLKNALDLDADGFVSKEDGLNKLQLKLGRALTNPIPVQVIAHYREIDPLDTGYVSYLAMMTTTDVVNQRPEHISAEDFEDGEKLGHDLITHKGQFLLAAGTDLTSSLINRLADIEDVFGLRFAPKA